MPMCGLSRCSACVGYVGMFVVCIAAVVKDSVFIAMRVSFCLPHPVAVSAFINCNGLCVCTEML